VKEKVERYLRSAEGRSFPRVATDVLLDIKGYFFADFDILPEERSGVFRSTCVEMEYVYTNEPLLNEVYGMVDYFGWSLIQWRARFGESRDRMPNLYPSQIHAYSFTCQSRRAKTQKLRSTCAAPRYTIYHYLYYAKGPSSSSATIPTTSSPNRTTPRSIASPKCYTAHNPGYRL
jgi:hypothetical protein